MYLYGEGVMNTILQTRQLPNRAFASGEHSSRGFTMVELMVVLSIMSILLMSGLPSMSGYIERTRLKAAAEGMANDFYLARSEAALRGPGSTVNLSFTNAGSSNWCYGLTTNASCDCTVTDPTEADACVVSDSGEDILKVVDGSGFKHGVRLAGVTFSGSQATFSGGRGLTPPGVASFVANGQQVDIAVTPLGRIHICSASSLGYNPCD